MDLDLIQQVRAGGSKVFINQRYRLDKLLHHSKFNLIFQGTDLITTHPVAVKMENIIFSYPQLLYEAQNMRNLQSTKGVP